MSPADKYREELLEELLYLEYIQEENTWRFKIVDEELIRVSSLFQRKSNETENNR